MKGITDIVKGFTRKWGIDIVRYVPQTPLPPGYDDDVVDGIIEQVSPFTMTGDLGINALCSAVKYVVANDIRGDIVECGVWKGGSMMAAAKMLLHMKDEKRQLHLFDTFKGMPMPQKEDIEYKRDTPGETLNEWKKNQSGGLNTWCYSSLAEVTSAMNLTGFDPARIHYVEGMVEDTLPLHAPEEISILRLDTDWYKSTYHELVHLYPHLSVGGVLIIDDYGHWKGARQAMDEYMKENNLKLLLNRINFSARIAVKLK
jgi:O-methyltransferase